MQTLVETLGPFKIELKEARASPTQLEFQAAFESHQWRTYAALGGNRSGKTITTGVLCFCKHLRDRAQDGDLYWVVAPSSEKSITGPQQVLWETLPKWMFGGKTYDARNGFDGNRPIITVTLPNNRGRCVINFKNCEQSATTFESDAVHGVWASESLPYKYFQRLIPRTIDHAAWILYDDIPEQGWHWDKLFNAPREAKVFCRVLTMYDNQQNLPEGEIDLAAARFSKEEREMRIYGRFRTLTGVVYKEFDRDLHVCPAFPIPSVGPYPSETNWPRWRILDYGGSAPTACNWVALAPNECAYVYRIYYQRGGNIHSHARAILDASVGHDGKPEQYVENFLDPHAWDTSPSNEISIADQYALEGIKFSPWPFVNVMGERAMVERVKRRLEVQQLKVMAHCEDLIHEFGAWKYKTNAEGNPLATDAYERDHNHLLDGLKGFFGTNPHFTIPGIRVR